MEKPVVHSAMQRSASALMITVLTLAGTATTSCDSDGSTEESTITEQAAETLAFPTHLAMNVDESPTHLQVRRNLSDSLADDFAAEIQTSILENRPWLISRPGLRFKQKDGIDLDPNVAQDLAGLLPFTPHSKVVEQMPSIDDDPTVVTYIGKIKSIEATPELLEKRRTTSTGLVDDSKRVNDFSDRATIWTITATKNEFLVEYSKSKVEKALASAKIKGEVAGDGDIEHEKSKRGRLLSGGVDNRVRAYGEDDPASGPVGSAMIEVGYERINPFGSAVLYGRRHIVTAAHVLFDKVGDDIVFLEHPRFCAARNGNQTIGCKYDTIALGRDAGWDDSPDGLDWAQDFGYAVLPDQIGPSPVARLGIAAWSVSQLQNEDVDLRNIGYPSCFTYPAPQNCYEHHLYKDQNPCTLGSGFYLVDGWNLGFQHSCDTNAGMSGGPVYFKTTTGNYYTWAVHAGTPSGTSPSATPNSLVRLTPYRFTGLLDMRDAKP